MVFEIYRDKFCQRKGDEEDEFSSLLQKDGKVKGKNRMKVKICKKKNFRALDFLVYVELAVKMWLHAD